MPVGGIDFPRRQLRCHNKLLACGELRPSLSPRLGHRAPMIPLGETVLAESPRTSEGRERIPNELLVADKDGSPIPQNRFSQTWSRAVGRAGLPAGTRFHDLRHTYASALIASGCSVKVVQAHLGHKSGDRRWTSTLTCGRPTRTGPGPPSRRSSAAVFHLCVTTRRQAN